MSYTGAWYVAPMAPQPTPWEITIGHLKPAQNFVAVPWCLLPHPEHTASLLGDCFQESRVCSNSDSGLLCRAEGTGDAFRCKVVTAEGLI
jgi:hypothetical protein